MTEGDVGVPPVVNGNNITLSGTRTPDANSDVDTLAKLTFEVLSSKSSELTLSKVHLTDNTDTTIHPWLVDGEIIALPISKEDVNADGIVDIQDLTAGCIKLRAGQTKYSRCEW